MKLYDKLFLKTIFIPVKWFNNVHSTEVSDKCEDALNLLSKAHGCEVSTLYYHVPRDCLHFISSLA